jgi:hypothetical protein
VKNIIKNRKASSSVFATLLIVIIAIASGIVLLNFVLEKMDFMKNEFNTQMGSILLKSFAINATHITTWIENSGTALLKITDAYVNGIFATLLNIVQIEPGSSATAYIKGVFMKQSTYAVKLLSLFNTVVTFEITY